MALFLPLGLLLPLVWEPIFGRLVPTLIVGFVLSSGIELAQLTLVDGRVTATDDAYSMWPVCLGDGCCGGC